MQLATTGTTATRGETIPAIYSLDLQRTTGNDWVNTSDHVRLSVQPWATGGTRLRTVTLFVQHGKTSAYAKLEEGAPGYQALVDAAEGMRALDYGRTKATAERPTPFQDFRDRSISVTASPFDATKQHREGTRHEHLGDVPQQVREMNDLLVAAARAAFTGADRALLDDMVAFFS